MAWTAELISKTRTGGRLNLDIKYDDGVGNTFNQNIVIDSPGSALDALKIVDARLKQLGKLDNLESNIVLGPINTSPVQVPPPTQVEIDRDAWLNKFERFRAMNRLVDLELMSDTDPPLVTLKTDLIAMWNNSYIDFV